MDEALKALQSMLQANMGESFSPAEPEPKRFKVDDNANNASTAETAGAVISPEELAARVEQYLMDNSIDTSAANDFRGCPPDVQTIVLQQGDVFSSHNPNGALINRIKAARKQCGSVYQRPVEVVNISQKYNVQEGDMASAVEVFLAENGVEDAAANDLRGAPPEVQELVLQKGSLAGTRNPNAALIIRIKNARIATGGSYFESKGLTRDPRDKGASKGAGSKGAGSKGAGRSFQAETTDVEEFITMNGIEGDSAADDLRGCPPEVQQIVLSKGSLRGTRNPGASCVIRIKNARLEVGSEYKGGGKGSGSGRGGGGGGGVETQDKNSLILKLLKGLLGGQSLQEVAKEIVGGAVDDPVEAFILENGLSDDPVADDLRGCPSDVQQIVLEKGGLQGTKNPAGALVGRIKIARQLCGSVYEGPGKKANAKGCSKGALSQPTPEMQQLMLEPDPVEAFLAQNEVLEDSAAEDLRGCPPDVQYIVMQQGSLLTARNPCATLISRIKKARMQCGSSYEGGSQGNGDSF